MTFGSQAYSFMEEVSYYRFSSIPKDTYILGLSLYNTTLIHHSKSIVFYVLGLQYNTNSSFKVYSNLCVGSTIQH